MPVPADHRSFRLTARIRDVVAGIWDTSKLNMAVARDHALERMPDRVDWARSIPFLLMHLACFAAIWTGVSTVAVAVAIGAYLVRMFAITGFYHRYFSHRTFKTSRAGQFIFGLLGASAVQRGPVWWAAHHRHHHANSDREADVHSPSQHGFWRSHTGWFLTIKGFTPDFRLVRDLMKFPSCAGSTASTSSCRYCSASACSCWA
jgi:fatty-acid desaturase